MLGVEIVGWGWWLGVVLAQKYFGQGRNIIIGFYSYRRSRLCKLSEPWVGVEAVSIARPVSTLQAENTNVSRVFKVGDVAWCPGSRINRTLFLFLTMTNVWPTGQWDIIQATLATHTSCFLMTIAITIKLGLVPFYFWFPEVLQGLSLTSG